MNPFRRVETNPFRQQISNTPSTSRNINLNLQRSLPSATAISKSLESINLHSNPPSPSSVQRAVSLQSLKTARPSATMAEVLNLHKQAASILNSGNVNIPPRPNSFSLQRLKPNPQTVRLMGKYLKNAAIGAGGVGGVISLTNFFSNNSVEKEKNNSENVTTGPIKSTTESEITNPIGTNI